MQDSIARLQSDIEGGADMVIVRNYRLQLRPFQVCWSANVVLD